MIPVDTLFFLIGTLTQVFASCDYRVMASALLSAGAISQTVISFLLTLLLIFQSVLWCRGVRDRALIITCSPIVSFDLFAGLCEHTLSACPFSAGCLIWSPASLPTNLAAFGRWLVLYCRVSLHVLVLFYIMLEEL